MSSEKHCGDGLKFLLYDYSKTVKRRLSSTFEIRYLEEIS